jgi:hypothetical protein
MSWSSHVLLGGAAFDRELIARSSMMPLARLQVRVPAPEDLVTMKVVAGRRLIPEGLRFVELRARIPRYQCDILRELARRDATSIDAILPHELEGVASVRSEPAILDLLGWRRSALHDNLRFGLRG